MKAITFAEFGGPEVLEIIDRPDPVPGAGEVVVAVTASIVNPTDLLNLGGMRAHLMQDLTPPYMTGMDFTGHILRIGEGVTGVAVGQPVVGVINPRRQAGGAHAQQICVPAQTVAPVDGGIDLIAAATVPMNALTGMLSLELLGLEKGQTLLITGAAGMLGSLCAELALIDGLVVVAVAGDADREFLTGLGVTSILPRGDELERALTTRFPEGVDGMIDGALIGREIAHHVRDGGRIISPRASHQIEDPRLEVFCVQVTSGVGDAAKMARIGGLLGEGKLTPRIAPGGTFHYSHAHDAYRMASVGGLRGRVVVTFED
jgi:NADPH:quinone reductase-like Zn-dependent oxidoreductase